MMGNVSHAAASAVFSLLTKVGVICTLLTVNKHETVTVFFLLQIHNMQLVEKEQIKEGVRAGKKSKLLPFSFCIQQYLFLYPAVP